MIRFYTLLITIILFSNSFDLHSQDKPKALRDTVDNAFDISNYLYNLHGLLPIISPITEPAVGYGAAAAAMYFIPKKNVEKGKFKMPDIAAAFGGYTANNTWFAGLGYFGFWKEDRVRYRGIIGYGSVNLKYYGAGNPILSKYPVKFNIDAFFLIQQAIFRINKSNFFLGGKYQFSKSKVTLFKDSEIPVINERDFDLIASGVSIISEYENFNNLFSPTKGIRIHLSYDQNLKVLGSDRDYGLITLFSHLYFPVKKVWVPGIRFESLLSLGDAPFYALPFISLRGVPAFRYQGEMTVLLETEQLFNIKSRWGVLGFAGVGTTIKSLETMEKGDTAWNVGVGFRYLIARMLGMKMGIDVARGNEDWAFYIVMGSSWSK